MGIGKENFLVQLRRHNEKALEYVLEEYGGLLLSVIRRHLYALPEMQEECMNDVLFKIWKHIDQFDEERSSFANWIAGIARYQSLDYLRKHVKQVKETSLEEIRGGREDRALEQLLEEELSTELSALLGCLGEEDRRLFLELFYEERTVEEVSRDTGLKKETIYNRVSRGRKKLRKWYQGKEGR